MEKDLNSFLSPDNGWSFSKGFFGFFLNISIRLFDLMTRDGLCLILLSYDLTKLR